MPLKHCYHKHWPGLKAEIYIQILQENNMITCFHFQNWIFENIEDLFYNNEYMITTKPYDIFLKKE